MSQEVEVLSRELERLRVQLAEELAAQELAQQEYEESLEIAQQETKDAKAEVARLQGILADVGISHV